MTELAPNIVADIVAVSSGHCPRVRLRSGCGRGWPFTKTSSESGSIGTVVSSWPLAKKGRKGSGHWELPLFCEDCLGPQ